MATLQSGPVVNDLWGGADLDYFNTGGKYNPGTDSWTATSIVSAPDARDGHTAVWTGSEMIVWGGRNNISLYIRIPAGNIIPAPTVGQPPAQLTRRLAEPLTLQSGRRAMK